MISDTSRPANADTLPRTLSHGDVLEMEKLERDIVDGGSRSRAAPDLVDETEAHGN